MRIVKLKKGCQQPTVMRWMLGYLGMKMLDVHSKKDVHFTIHPFLNKNLLINYMMWLVNYIPLKNGWIVRYTHQKECIFIITYLENNFSAYYFLVVSCTVPWKFFLLKVIFGSRCERLSDLSGMKIFLRIWFVLI